jgi:hypothetical protein
MRQNFVGNFLLRIAIGYMIYSQSRSVTERRGRRRGTGKPVSPGVRRDRRVSELGQGGEGEDNAVGDIPPIA